MAAADVFAYLAALPPGLRPFVVFESDLGSMVIDPLSTQQSEITQRALAAIHGTIRVVFGEQNVPAEASAGTLQSNTALWGVIAAAGLATWLLPSPWRWLPAIGATAWVLSRTGVPILEQLRSDVARG